jgi:hypothetical protein
MKTHMFINTPKYKELSRQLLLSHFQSLSFKLSAHALIWLMESTMDNDGHAVPNTAFYYDLLCRMRTNEGSDTTYRRPLILAPGHLQFSEETLARDWNLGRRRIRGILAQMAQLGLIRVDTSRVASSIAQCSLTGWSDPAGQTIPNPAAAPSSSSHTH